MNVPEHSKATTEDYTPPPGPPETMPEHIAARGRELVRMPCYIICYRPDPAICWTKNFTPIKAETFCTTDINKRNRILEKLGAAKMNGQPLYIVTLNIVEISQYLDFQN